MVQIAQIDDTLAQAADRRDRVLLEVRKLPQRPPDNALAWRRQANKLRLMVPETPMILVDYLVESPEEELEHVIQLLAEMMDFRIRERLIGLMSRYRSDAVLSQRLEQARITIEQQLVPLGLPENLGKVKGMDLWRYLAGANWEASSPGRIGELWVKNLANQAQSMRQRVLKDLLSNYPQLFDCVLEYEAHWGGKAMTSWCLTEINKLPDDVAIPLLHRLQYHRDQQTRQRAQKYLQKKNLQNELRQKRDNGCDSAGAIISEISCVSPVQLQKTSEPTTIRAYVTGVMSGRGSSVASDNSDEESAFSGPVVATSYGTTLQTALKKALKKRNGASHGMPRQMTLILVKQTPDSPATSSLFSLMLDFRERGMIECFGMEGVESEGLEETMREFNGECNGAGFEPIPLSCAMLLANGAAALCLSEKQVLPGDYFFYRHFITETDYDASGFALPLNRKQTAKLGEWRDLVSSRRDSSLLPW